jgi:DNA-binding winged helix-turn-helix (wHTH) protein
LPYHARVSSGAGFTFGPFRVDLSSRRLFRDQEPLPISSRHFDVLVALVSQAGTVIPKNTLVEAGWQDVAVTDNSLEQAISMLRVALGAGPDGKPYIRTVPRRGYCFMGDVTPARVSDAGIDAVLEPHRAWLEGRMALETLGRRDAEVARRAFEHALEFTPHDPALHVGLANACAWQFEATRADERPDVASLACAMEHAREACGLDLHYAEAWATLGFVLHRTGQGPEALAASRRAVTLEPGSWRHHLRLAFVSWGEERLRASERARQILPDLALAHWLAATVHVARQALDRAERELDAGAAAQDSQSTTAPFGAVGLHWLRGLVRLQRGDDAGALESFERELSFETSGHLYARECAANTCYGLAALRLRAGDRAAARAALVDALARIPAHAPAVAVLGWLDGDQPSSPAAEAFDAVVARLTAKGATAEAAAALAVRETLAGRVGDAAGLVHHMLDVAPAGNAGWTVPVEPMLQVASHPDEWRGVLALLRARAA